MGTALAEPTAKHLDVRRIEAAVINGDLSKLSTGQRVDYYAKVCTSVWVNPFTKPFEYIKMRDREVLYATKNCAEQLRDMKRVTVAILTRERSDGLYIVTARATLPDGRSEESIGA